MKSAHCAKRNAPIAQDEMRRLRQPRSVYREELSLKNKGGPVDDSGKEKPAGVPAGNRPESEHAPASPGVIDPERVHGLQKYGERLDMEADEVTSLLQQHGLYAVETALAEPIRAGQKLIDRSARERIAESASARFAADNDLNAVNEQIAKIPPQTLERLKSAALAEMGHVPRSVAMRRGFADSLAWKIAVATIWRKELTNVASFG
jgi:hypothetical protein